MIIPTPIYHIVVMQNTFNLLTSVNNTSHKHNICNRLSSSYSLSYVGLLGIQGPRYKGALDI